MIAYGTNFERMADLALSQIRRYGEKDAQVLISLLQTLQRVADVLPPGSRRREVLRAHLEEIAACMERAISSDVKRLQIERQIQKVREALSG